MSEKELKFERKSKIIVAVPFIILISVLLFMSSCATTSCNQRNAWSANCPAYR